mmetsp:Transcript_5531/g.11374  ORF Transcript_5531/g.11374 Transcript_5531/m.11374 type:complete len:84 (+) Transcript_5531:167-418(+)
MEQAGSQSTVAVQETINQQPTTARSRGAQGAQGAAMLAPNLRPHRPLQRASRRELGKVLKLKPPPEAFHRTCVPASLRAASRF